MFSYLSIFYLLFFDFLWMQEAELAKEKTNGYKLDRAHIFAVNMFDDFDKYMRVPDEWAPPEIKPYTPGVIFSIQCFGSKCIWFTFPCNGHTDPYVVGTLISFVLTYTDLVETLIVSC